MLLLTLNFFISPIDKNFKIVKIIGGEQDGDNILYSISGAILTSCKDIIVSSGRGNFIARYDWDGNFINKIGMKGKGPGEFLYPTSLSISNEKLYFLDKFNSRFVETDLNLENIRYFKLPQESFGFCSSLNVTNNGMFVASFLFNKSQDSRIYIFDRNLKLKNKFFGFSPIKIDKKNEKNYYILERGCDVLYGLDDKFEKMLITFVFPDNPMDFYLYSINGKMIKKFSYELDKKYHFPHFIYKRSSRVGAHVPNIKCVFFHSHVWYVFVELNHIKSEKLKDIESKFFYIKYNKDGEFIGKYPMDIGFDCFYVSKEGYILGKHLHTDEDQLMIYKILN